MAKQKYYVKNKGLVKKRQTCFKKGEDPKRNIGNKLQDNNTEDVRSGDVNRPCQRHEKDYLDLLTNETYANEFSIPGADGRDGSAMILRAKTTDKPADTTPEVNHDNSGHYNIYLTPRCYLEYINIIQI